MSTLSRKPYPSDVSDDEWALVAPYLTLLREDAAQRHHDLREVFNALRWLVRTGAPWRLLPHDLPPWEAVYQQTQRWLLAGCFEALVHDLRTVLRQVAERSPQPTAVIVDSRTVQSTLERGARAGYDGAKRHKGSKTHLVVDTLGHLLTAFVTAADEQDRAQVAHLAGVVQQLTGQSVELAYVDQGYTGAETAAAAAAHGIQLEVVKLPEAKRGFVLLPRRWVVERTQPHYPRRPRRDRWPVRCDDRTHRVAAPGRGRRAGASGARFATRGRGRAMSGPAVSHVPPRPVRARGAVAGSTYR
jgi:transposase